MSFENPEGQPEIVRKSVGDILTFKTLSCAISLGTGVLTDMIGDSISESGDVEIAELMATTIMTELNV